jgi:hypothetical protein
MDEEKKSAPDMQNQELAAEDLAYLRNSAEKSFSETFGVVGSKSTNN